MPNPRLSRVPAGSRERFLPLFLLADESAQQVQSYMNTGDLYVYCASSHSAVADRAGFRLLNLSGHVHWRAMAPRLIEASLRS
jgi:hypothetical protein